MTRFNRILWIILFTVGLTACDLPATSLIPTPYPDWYLPTVIALTAQAALPPSPAGPQAGPSQPSPEPGPSLPPPTPTRTPIPPLQTPTPTLTPTPTPPPVPIEITSPGPLSKITSPLRLRGYVVPGDKNLVNVELFGEDGRLIAQNLTRLYGSTGAAYISLDLPFTVSLAAELGRLQVTTSDQYGRPLAIASVHVILLSAGNTVVNPPGPAERCVFFSPAKAGMTFRGGSLQVRGRYQPFSLEPAFLELLDTNGKVLDSRPLTFSGLEMQTFASTLTYNVNEPTSALLILRQPDHRIPGPFFVFSREVTLLP